MTRMGARMLDAPVSGSVPQAEQGTLAIMVGGGRAAFDRVEPLLAQRGRPVTHVGGNGHGVLLKLAINIGCRCCSTCRPTPGSTSR